MAPAFGENATQVIKKQRMLNKPVDKWVWKEFVNQARTDAYKLSHWTREDEKNEIYPFAKWNKQADVVRYTADEYEKYIEPFSSDWTKEETDHLIRLCERFSMKFIVIADRFEQMSDYEEEESKAKDHQMKRREVKAKDKNSKKMRKLYKDKYPERTVDEIKERYYSIAKILLEKRN